MTMRAGMKYETGGRLVRGDGTEYEIVAVRPDGTLHLRRLAGSGLYTGTFKREPVPDAGTEFTPTVAPAQNVDAAKAQQYGRAWSFIRRLAAQLWPTDVSYRESVISRMQSDPESEVQAQLDKWVGMLETSLKEPIAQGYAGLSNQFDSLAFQRSHVQLWAAAVVARGMTPPDPIALSDLDGRAGAIQNLTGQALISAAYALGHQQGMEVQQRVGLWGILWSMKDDLVRIIEALVSLGEEVARLARDSGVGLGLGLVLALAAVLLLRR